MGCGKSKHVAIENTISRKNSIVGSKKGKTPEIGIGESSKLLERNATSLMEEEGKIVVSRKNSKAEFKRVKTEKRNGDMETECDAVENTMGGENSGEASELDRKTSSLRKEEGEIVEQDSIADDSKVVVDGNSVVELETSQVDGNMSLLLIEEDGKGVVQDSVVDDSEIIVDGNGVIDRLESKEPIEETSEPDENMSSSTKEEGEDSIADNSEAIVDNENGITENAEQNEGNEKLKLGEETKGDDTLEDKQVEDDDAKEGTANEEADTVKGENLGKEAKTTEEVEV
ncbi:hypothetical protein Gogos_013887 [Gossypium gossypioides]|uniref:Uncharacterized protein n=1 Tax=Gossypium gossypioides TaxID=34282 RepID=A0A7J9BX93_GOSGO|nr:hypothetical protein [Gossypium gossypioides]